MYYKIRIIFIAAVVIYTVRKILIERLYENKGQSDLEIIKNGIKSFWAKRRKKKKEDDSEAESPVE